MHALWHLISEEGVTFKTPIFKIIYIYMVELSSLPNALIVTLIKSFEYEVSKMTDFHEMIKYINTIFAVKENLERHLVALQVNKSIENMRRDKSKQFIHLGWCQGYMGLLYHMQEAIIEKKLKNITPTSCPQLAIFSKKYYNDINELNHEKKYDYCFIGSIDSCYERRKWVIDFAKKNFTKDSIFINTDNSPNWELLGPFDYSKLKLGFCPRLQEDIPSKRIHYRIVKDNIEYFEKMCQSKFVLCPGGDAPWSFRFYEVLMCKSLPIVSSWHHTYRTKEESELNYRYILYQDIENIKNIVNCDDYVNENTKIFENYHLLK